MTGHSLPDFLHLLEQKKLLQKITVPVSTDLEIAELTLRSFSKTNNALLFDNPDGRNHPVITNIFGTTERIELAFGCSLYEAGNKILAQKNLVSAVRTPEFTASYDPPDLPFIKSWTEEDGKYFTMAAIVTKQKEKIEDIGIYRIQIHKDYSLSFFPHKGSSLFNNIRSALADNSTKIKCAVLISPPPVLLYISALKMPDTINKYSAFAAISNDAEFFVEDGLLLPANAEGYIIGDIQINQQVESGKSANFTGYYSMTKGYKILPSKSFIKKGCTTVSSIVDIPPSESTTIALSSLNFFLPYIQKHIPKIKNIVSTHADIYKGKIKIFLYKDADTEKCINLIEKFYFFDRMTEILIIKEGKVIKKICKNHSYFNMNTSGIKMIRCNDTKALVDRRIDEYGIKL